MTPAEDFGQLRLKFTDPVQHHYEVIRPIVLFSETIYERSRQTGVERTKRFVQKGMGPFERWDMIDMIPLDGMHYIGQAAPATLFFQFANQDEGVSQETALRYYDAASEPKLIK